MRTGSSSIQEKLQVVAGMIAVHTQEPFVGLSCNCTMWAVCGGDWVVMQELHSRGDTQKMFVMLYDTVRDLHRQ